MSNTPEQKDLIVLVADLDMEQAMSGILKRHKSFNIREISFDIRRHPDRDAGCRTRGVEFLRNFGMNYSHALLMFDKDGSGQESLDIDNIEQELNQQLSTTGWDERAATIVFNPELEIWIWSDSPHVDRVCGWENRIPSLRDWLISEKYLTSGDTKPRYPREAFRHALRKINKPPSASLFRKLAEQVSFQRCNDRSFLRLKALLENWFPIS